MIIVVQISLEDNLKKSPNLKPEVGYSCYKIKIVLKVINQDYHNTIQKANQFLGLASDLPVVQANVLSQSCYKSWPTFARVKNCNYLNWERGHIVEIGHITDMFST